MIYLINELCIKAYTPKGKKIFKSKQQCKERFQYNLSRYRQQKTLQT